MKHLTIIVPNGDNNLSSITGAYELFNKATGNTPIEYSQRVKIEKAKKSFETTRRSINEVMYDVGYSDVKAFREVFRKYTGISPLEYKGKYNKDGIHI